VKQQTKRLMEKYRLDLERLKYTTDHKESKLEADNTAHFLALSYVPDLDEELEREIAESPMTPLFKTQLNMEDAEDRNSTTNSFRSPAASVSNEPLSKPPPAPDPPSHIKKKSTTTSKAGHASNNKKNFIKRNIELAQEAGGTLAMTDEERQRLNELMIDMDEVAAAKKPDLTPSSKSEMLESEESNSSQQIVVEYNPMAVQVAQGDGFTPDPSDSHRLKQIDSVLERRTVSVNSRYSSPQHNFNNNSSSSKMGSSLSSFHQNHSSSLGGQVQHTVEADAYASAFMLGGGGGGGGGGTESKQIKLNDDFDENQFGDKFIREVRITREQELKLTFIESELEKLKALKQTSVSSQRDGDSMSMAGSGTSSSNQFMHHEGSEQQRSSSSTVSLLIGQQQLRELLDEYANESSSQLVPFDKQQ
jgi:hypothetical protein